VNKGGIGAVDGHVRMVRIDVYDAMGADDPGLLYCTPD
jgi:hypothetical protein